MEFKVITDALPQEAIQIRTEVFVEEQGFYDEFDDIDKTATHIIAYQSGVPAGVCRVFFDPKAERYMLGRLAVRRAYRGIGLGKALVFRAEQAVREWGGDCVVLHAQCQASAFYRACGYQEQGDADDEQGCPHVWMKKQLT